jgi:hypothetical protein
MRNAIVSLPTQRSIGERRQLLRSAVLQLARVEMYLAAVTYMDLGDKAVDRTIGQLRAEVDGLRRYLIERRDGTRP